VKYSASDFQQAIASIESGEATFPLLKLARVVAQSTERSSIPKKPKGTSARLTPKQQLQAYIGSLRGMPDNNSRLLAEFLTAISERTLLKNAATLRNYATHLGVAIGTKPDRSLIARRIGERLRENPAVLEEKIALGSKLGGTGSSLQAWSDVIVKDER
jgi:hypothetical protein